MGGLRTIKYIAQQWPATPTARRLAAVAAPYGVPFFLGRPDRISDFSAASRSEFFGGAPPKLFEKSPAGPPAAPTSRPSSTGGHRDDDATACTRARATSTQ